MAVFGTINDSPIKIPAEEEEHEIEEHGIEEKDDADDSTSRMYVHIPSA